MAGMGKQIDLRMSGVDRFPPPVVWPVAAEADDDPLGAIMTAMTQEIEADGVMVALHERHRDPVVLFAQGAGETTGDCMDYVLAPAWPGGAEDEWSVMQGDSSVGLMTTSIQAGRAMVTVTAVFRRLGDTTVTRARTALARVRPLLRPFVRLWAQGRRSRSQVRALTSAVNQTGIGIVLVNERGEPGFLNAAAQALLAEGDGLRLSNTLLGGNTLADTLRLQVAVEHVLGGNGGESAAAPVVALGRTARRPLMAAVVPIDRDADAGADGAAVIYIFDPEQDLCTLLDPACRLYGLSPVESRLTCLLADGLTLADAAKRMRVRELTARSYLKQIFLKTDTNRQAELVWLMLKSSVRTAPGRSANFVGTPI